MSDMGKTVATDANNEGVQLEAPIVQGPEDADRDLILRTLELSPEERLAVLQDFVDTFWTIQHG